MSGCCFRTPQNDDRFIVVASDLEAALQVHQLPSRCANIDAHIDL
eukprot:SAG31_NODE_638_length_13329_cov_13.538095_6_plen_45_part_00